jgi:hypothetical protein
MEEGVASGVPEEEERERTRGWESMLFILRYLVGGSGVRLIVWRLSRWMVLKVVEVVVVVGLEFEVWL